MESLSIGVFFGILVSCSALPPPIFEQLRSHPQNSGIHMTGHSTMIRVKRNPSAMKLVLQTIQMMKTLLRGAQQLPSDTRVRLYQKPGSYTQALHDFSSVNPEEVVDFKMKNGVYGRIGQVGDYSLMVKTSGNSGKATLEVMKAQIIPRTGRKTTLTAGQLTDKITYTSLH